MGSKRSSEFRKQSDEAMPAAVNTSDHAVLDILSRIKATKDPAEIRILSDQLEHVIFHKQYSHS
jgi:Xaa-Pro aminopeptidase